jgi:hypothetical protein
LQALSSSTSHAGMATSASASSNIAQSSSLSHSLPATILNLEDNKVKIQVPGLQQQQTTASRTHSAVSKQTSLDKGDCRSCYWKNVIVSILVPVFRSQVKSCVWLSNCHCTVEFWIQ